MKEITKRAYELVNEIHTRYKQKVGNLNFPINEYVLITILEEMKGIKIELEEIKKENSYRIPEGVLIPRRGGFLIRYVINPLRYSNNNERIISPVVRKRFTICHELAHILFYDCNSTVPKLYVNHEEYICDDIARRLLLPEETLRIKFQRYRADIDNLIPFLREIAKEAKVSIYPLVKRVIEDLSLLENTMITFWFLKKVYKDELKKENPIVILERVDSKLSKELKNNLTLYWRRQIRKHVWNKAIKMIIDKEKEPPIFLSSQYIEGKRRKKGKLKKVLFNVECDFYTHQQKLFKYDFLFLPQFISVEKIIKVELWP
jgi:Zn-dependent peptidase ImmA (M78 family)